MARGHLERKLFSRCMEFRCPVSLTKHLDPVKGGRPQVLDGRGSFRDAILDAPEIDDRFDAALDALLAPEAYTGLAAAFVDRVLAGEA